MVLEKILDLIENENISLEFNTLKYLSSINQLADIFMRISGNVWIPKGFR